HDDDLLLVGELVEAGDLERRAVGYGGLARLQIHFHAILFGERPQPPAKGIERIISAGEMDAAAEANPFYPFEPIAELLHRPRQKAVEELEILVLAVVVDHEPIDAAEHRPNLFRVPFAQAAKRPGGIGKIEFGRTYAGVQPQPPRDRSSLLAEPFKLRKGVE